MAATKILFTLFRMRRVRGVVLLPGWKSKHTRERTVGGTRL